ncbi:sugar (pentulose or hexulose) kinase [Chitinophaga dinghuensis]|uniref:Sugar (Pentulose or hexulose) kinase n=1 Tax=Chitinophaga dinghuensis TaxID=1539050 RepID=A0A327WBY1_9BACT|nr:FGGY family carbohydrate kinase [Chitinophaga dinghuensis]RAJ88025.1 sugar (pentulose or hexulose) kinase [Chitinophaga dinghuensis]
MKKTPVIVIFDVGKTNKKLLLFDEQYQLIFERTARFNETTDEDGDPCENLESLRLSVFDSLREVFKKKDVEVKAINCSTYGASFVYIDEEGRPLTPLYNYLKQYPAALQQNFYHQYGGEDLLSVQMSSPVLGSLNSGMQLYRLKYEQPAIFQATRYALHLPQYMSYLLTGVPASDITSIGCHTNLWNFQENKYHHWVYQEGIYEKLAPIMPAAQVLPPLFPGNTYQIGTGLHDSSAALIPYLVCFHEPFILLSTGTWCISLNPFNHTPLTAAELRQDCLCYMTYQGNPVKASRLFAGYEHEQQMKRIAAHFGQATLKYRHMEYDPTLPLKPAGIFAERDLHQFSTDTAAYHQLLFDLAAQQYQATRLVMNDNSVKRIFVDGGFSKNQIYMNMLAMLFTGVEVFAASMAQATAMGAALAIHNAWNSKNIPNGIIELKYYAGGLPIMAE